MISLDRVVFLNSIDFLPPVLKVYQFVQKNQALLHSQKQQWSPYGLKAILA